MCNVHSSKHCMLQAAAEPVVLTLLHKCTVKCTTDKRVCVCVNSCVYVYKLN